MMKNRRRQPTPSWTHPLNGPYPDGKLAATVPGGKIHMIEMTWKRSFLTSKLKACRLKLLSLENPCLY